MKKPKIEPNSKQKKAPLVIKSFISIFNFFMLALTVAEIAGMLFDIAKILGVSKKIKKPSWLEKVDRLKKKNLFSPSARAEAKFSDNKVENILFKIDLPEKKSKKFSLF
jgi:hypothetical protein